jgi:PTH1 family peptidyl-tRNA hydrolase
VGQRVLDHIAQSLGGEWTRQEQALVARIEWRGIPVYFIKPLTTVNATGPMLVPLIQQLGIRLADCVLVHDDADLPLGNVRVRMRSSDSGHQGVRSVFKAFHTDDLCRLRVGVGRPAQQGQLDDHVTTAFSSVELSIIDQACAEAADRVLELVGGHSNRERVTDG